MSKLTDELEMLLKVYNPHGFTKLGGGKVWIEYSPQATGRASMAYSSGYKVIGVGFKVNLSGPWYDNGSMVFAPFNYGDDKQRTKEAAMEWASARFGVREWVKAPWRETWVSRETYDAVMDKLNAVRNGSSE